MGEILSSCSYVSHLHGCVDKEDNDGDSVNGHEYAHAASALQHIPPSVIEVLVAQFVPSDLWLLCQ